MQRKNPPGETPGERNWRKMRQPQCCQERRSASLPVLAAVAQEGKARLAAPRNAKDAARFAAKVTAIAAQIKDPARRRAWLESLAATLKGHETFPAGKKIQRDPAADAILKLLATPAAS